MPKDLFVRKYQTPTNIRLGDLKAPLQKQAMDLDRSLSSLICKILREYLTAEDKKYKK